MKKTLSALVLAGASLVFAPQLASAMHANRPARSPEFQYNQWTRYDAGDRYSSYAPAYSQSLPRKYRPGGL